MELILLFINFLQINLFIILLLEKPIKSEEISCNLTHPILKNGKCEYIYCSQVEFNSSICIIKNEIVKIQWLTSLIPISDLKYRYISPAISKNNDLIIQTTKSTGSPKRKFYGINKNGRFYFKDSNDEESPYFSINVEDGDDLYMYENVGAIINLENDENDYFISVGCYYTSYTELIDFKKGTISRIQSGPFYHFPIYSDIGTIFEMSKEFYENDSKKYYIFSFISYYEGFYLFMTKIMCFNPTDISNGFTRITYKTEFTTNFGKIASCFEAFPSYYIFCLFLNDEYKFKVIVYESNLNLDEKYSKTIDFTSEEEGNENFFLKTLHLKENVGFFLYYKTIDCSYPFIRILEYDGNENFNNFNSFGLISLNKYNFNYNLHLNDMIKIKDNQICFSSTNNDKDTLYIVIFNFYNDYEKFVIRYYEIKLYDLYHKKILFEIKLAKYGDYISLCTSLCSNYQCSSNNDNHYSYLMIFNYPNSTDVNFDLINHLLNTDETISSINVNLSNYVKIENNIFGYIFKGIKIIEIPEKINIKSSLKKIQ